MTVEIRGRTGTGKSGMALALAEEIGLEPDQVADAVHFQARPYVTAVRREVARRRRPTTQS